MMKMGFDYMVCKDCAYNKNSKCTKVDRSVYCLSVCPDGNTWESIREIYAEIRRRIDRSKRLMALFDREDDIEDRDMEMFEQEYNFG